MTRARRLLMVAVTTAVALSSGEAFPQSPASSQGATSPDALVAQAQSLSAAYDYEGAIEQLEAAVRIDPLHLEANELLMSMVRQVRGSDALEARYRQLVATHADSASAYYLLSRALRSSDARETYLRLALRIDPEFAPAAMALASRYYGRDRADQALRLARQAVAAMPGDYRTASLYVSMLGRFDRTDEAIAFLKQMTAQYPHELRFWRRLWRLELSAMGRERSLDRLRPQIDALRHRFMDSLAHMELLAEVLEYGDGRDRAEAIELWQRIAERYPDHPRAELALLRAMNTARDVDEKMRILQVLEERYPESPARYAAYPEIIGTLIREERHEEAIELSKTLITLPDPGFREVGVGRDDRVLGMSMYGTSFECIGHSGWFTAAQMPVFVARRRNADWYGIMVGRDDLAEQTVITPQAAAAGRSLATSGCDAPHVYATVGQELVKNPAFRVLGIELLERAVTIGGNLTAGSASGGVGMAFAVIDRLRELLPYYYLQEGRLDAAVRAVDRLYAGQDRRSGRFYRIAGEVYEAAGRLQDAKRAYLRALSTRRDADIANAALHRLYALLADDDIEVLDGKDAPRLPVRGTRVTRIHLGIEAPLHRFLDERPTLMVLWSRTMEGTHEYVASLPRLEDHFDGRVATLSIAVGSSAESVVRRLQRDPISSSAERGVAISYETLEKWRIEELPTTLLVDARGRVLARQTSYGVPVADWIEAWEAIVRELFDASMASDAEAPLAAAGEMLQRPDHAASKKRTARAPSLGPQPIFR